MSGLGVFSIGTLPFTLIAAAAAVTAGYFLLTKISMNDGAEIIMTMVTIWLVVVAVLFFISLTCTNISPGERFASMPTTSVSEFETELLAREGDVCGLVAEVEIFVKSRLGQKAVDNPTLVGKAMDIGEPLTVCPSLPLTAATINDRLTRMERTLDGLIDPNMKSTLKASSCESYADYEEEPKEEEEEKPSVEQKQRLANIKTHIELVKLQYLRPIHAIQDDTRKGIVSDKCKGLATKAAV